MAVSLPSDYDRASVVDLELRQRAFRIESDFYQFCVLAQECLNKSYWSRFRCESPEEYFEARIGVSYRSLRRRLSVLEAVQRLPEEARDRAIKSLAEIGSHKAGILAPAIRAGQSESGATWDQWIEHAQNTSIPALQEHVSEQLGLARRSASEPGSRFLAMLLNQMPDEDAREIAERAFALARREADTRNNVAAFLAMCREFIGTYGVKG